MLKDLFTANGVTGAAVATALFNAVGRVDPLLFERIDQGRQGLPLELVPLIAIVLDVSQADVAVAASKLTVATGAISRVPLPPQLGDEFQAVQFAISPS